MNPQKFLIDKHIGDIILNDTPITLPEDRIYVSDIMRQYLKESLNLIVKKYYEDKNATFKKGGTLKTFEYYVLDYLKENNI